MDAIALNLTQGSLAPATTAGLEPAQEGTTGPIDFAALLALGLEAAKVSVAPPGAADAASLEAERQNDAGAALETLELLAAAALPAVMQDATPHTERAQQGAQAAREPLTLANLLAGATNRAAAEDAALADTAARFAVSGAQAQTAEVNEAALDAQAFELTAAAEHARGAVDAARGAEASLPLAHTPIVESRPQAAQPSALLEVAAPVSEPGFADALSRQVVWMVDKDAAVAELRINPPELGPVEVRLTLNGDEALAQFASPHAEVREAIESAIARLREAMAQAGVQLGETSVSAESFSGEAAHAERRAAREQHADSRGAHEGAGAGLPERVRRGLVDIFA